MVSAGVRNDNYVPISQIRNIYTCHRQYVSGLVAGCLICCMCSCVRDPSLNTPLQMGARPNSVMCCLCLGHGKALVSISAVCWASRQACVMMYWCCISCHMEWYFKLMCCVVCEMYGLLAVEIALRLSHLIGKGVAKWNPSSSYKFWSQRASVPACDNATYFVKSAAGLKEYIEEGLAPSQHNYFVAWLMLKP